MMITPPQHPNHSDTAPWNLARQNCSGIGYGHRLVRYPRVRDRVDRVACSHSHTSQGTGTSARRTYVRDVQCSGVHLADLRIGIRVDTIKAA